MDNAEPQPTPTEVNPPAPQESQPAPAAPQEPQEPQEPQAPQPEPTSTEPITPQPTPAKPKKSHKKLIIIIAIVVLIVLGAAGTALALVLNQNHSDDSNDDQSSASSLPQQISDFDLAFLDGEAKNQLYSPLSIKYALGMLEEGAAGDSKAQIASAIGSLAPQKYPNSKNMSFANALFINNALPEDTIKPSYTAAISDKFGAEILHIPFSSAAPINSWVSNKTFDLINDLVTDEMLKPSDAPEQYFVLVNALAIDMEWIDKIQPQSKDYSVTFPHINYGSYVEPFETAGFNRLPFNNSSIDVDALHLAATIHKYDILSDLGTDKIRQTIIDEYTKWLNDENGGIYCAKEREEPFPAPEVYVDQYMQELGDGGYRTVKSSTDFSLYDSSEVKVFAKDLRTYDGVTLQYVGIMPKTISLKEYLQNLTTNKLASTINQLKPIAYDNFKDGVITDIIANIPVFKFGDKLNLVQTLQGIGITDIFSETKADLSNLANDPAGLRIGAAIHQTTVDFSNDGIKASAATALIGGKGAGGCAFYYDFEVPVETIDLTFDNPYLFLIRDKNSGTVWFVGTVYEPTQYTQPNFQ